MPLCGARGGRWWAARNSSGVAPCHSPKRGENKVGSSLTGVFRCKSRTEPSYSYSSAIKRRMVPAPGQVRQRHEDEILRAGHKRSAGRNRPSENALEIEFWETSRQLARRAGRTRLPLATKCGPVPEPSRSASMRAMSPCAVGLACTQQPRQMFPIARSTAASSGVGLSMASGIEGSSADVG